jgi:limonene-1,2-epoxide hydrolase
MAASNEESFRAMIRMWADGAGPMQDSLRKYFADDCVWEQPGFPTTRSLDEALQISPSMDDLGLASIEVEYVNVAAAGDVVFTERADWLIRKDGTRLGPFPVVGVTEFRDGKIIAWREYYDTAGLSTLFGDSSSS